MFSPSAFNELCSKCPHIYSLGEPIANSSHTMVLEKPAESALSILDSLHEFQPFCEQTHVDVANASRL
ncbi:hypothetical protein PF005_g11928 [Phytophthora fragariae]|uniref:Uncharacterized protein n=2 Tax=Phytophthora TaxID=4783 RepID=A0A6A3U7Q9_9STRA|nr:hypothetical protein PF003_g33967 [Phytophthora fragariae]KAE9043779.1 hypothetical protein PR002_g3155 [Phytophthora rubi]KAE8936075.1 hypothetical protein PF009_g13995 [Phytophthora fragariae]KAE9006083.1 hypothetical protein PF011_g11759 [Phytophthora fragariae]KAE9049595.1 hypothetical protein PR001_g3169 [Phytophthora rubi]